MRWWPPPACARKRRWRATPDCRLTAVGSQLQTSDPAIYALGDCAEINGVVLPFLQPILLSAMCLSKICWRRRENSSCRQCW